VFCPKCGAEYKEGVTVCADCGVKLVDKLPEEKREEEPFELVEIFETFNEGDIAMIKSIFEANGIRYFLKDENFHTLRPLVQPVVVMVVDKDVERAKKLLSELKLSIRAFSPPEEEKEE